MLLLPSSPRRAWLRSFWAILSLGSGLLLGIVLALAVSPWMFSLGLLFALIMGMPGLLCPQCVSLPYRCWNRMGALYARGVQLLLLAMCYYIVFAATGRVGSRLQIARPEAATSLWVPRGTLPPVAYPHPYAAANAAPQQGWLRTYIAWAMRSRNPWAVSLVPFLLLLQVLDIRRESHFPSNIYTLF